MGSDEVESDSLVAEEICGDIIVDSDAESPQKSISDTSSNDEKTAYTDDSSDDHSPYSVYEEHLDEEKMSESCTALGDEDHNPQRVDPSTKSQDISDYKTEHYDNDVYDEDDAHPGIQAVSSTGSDEISPLAREAGNFFDNDYDSENDSIYNIVKEKTETIKHQQTSKKSEFEELVTWTEKFNLLLREVDLNYFVTKIKGVEVKNFMEKCKDYLSRKIDSIEIAKKKEHLHYFFQLFEHEVVSLNLSKLVSILVVFVAVFIGKQMGNRGVPEKRNTSDSNKEFSIKNGGFATEHRALFFSDVALNAAAAGDIDLLKYVVKLDSDNVHSTDSNLWTPLHECARSGNLDCVSFLIDRGADTSAKTTTGETPLSIAMSVHGENHGVTSSLVESLVKSNWSEDQRLEFFSSFLNMIDNGVTDQQKDENVMNFDSETLMDPRKAASTGDLHSLQKYLLDHDFDVNEGDSKGWTLLHEAARGGHSNIVSYLVENGANVFIETTTGETPIALSQLYHNADHPVFHFLDTVMAEMVEMTLSAAANGDQEKLRQLLLESPSLLNAKDSNGWAAIHEAAKEGNILIVEMLFLLDVNVLALTRNGESALDIAIKVHGKSNILVDKLSIAIHSALGENDEGNGSTSAFPTEATFSPIALEAAANGNYELLLSLLNDQPHLLNMQDDHGWAPIHEAAKMGHEPIIRLLFDLNADTALKTIDGHSALAISNLAHGPDHHITDIFLEHELNLTDEASPEHSFDDTLALISAGDLSGLGKLVEKDASLLENYDFKGWTMLHHAIYAGNMPIIKYLIGEGIDLWARTRDGENALDLGLKLYGEDHDMVDYLVDTLMEQLKTKEQSTMPEMKTDDINLDIENLSALEMVELVRLSASEDDTVTLLKLIEKNSLIVHVSDTNGWGALHEAARAGHLISVILLLQNSANANAGSSGGNPLGIAQEYFEVNHPVIEALKNAKQILADHPKNNNSVEIVENFLRTASEGTPEDLLNLIELNPLLLHVKDLNGWGGIHEVARSGSVEKMKIMLARGADISAGSSGGTPIQLAIRYHGLEHPLPNFIQLITRD